MTKHMEYEIGNFSNTVALSIEPGLTDYSREKDTAKVSVRFLQAALLLPQNEILGWQAAACSDKSEKGYVFASPGAGISADDINWIFKSYGAADYGIKVKARDFYEDDRKIYVLASVQGSSMDISEVRKKERSIYDYDYCETVYDGYLRDMVAMLMEEDAVIRIIAGPCENAAGHGMFLISLPTEMSLRMRTLISLAFPHMAAKELKEFSQTGSCEKLIPDQCFVDGMSRFLYTFICRASEKAFGKEAYDAGPSDALIPCEDGCKENEAEENPANIPIEKMDLSVRAYNCLRRAGVDTAEDLLMMTDEDFKHIRNLGRKTIEEIKNKLSKISVSIAPVPLKKAGYTDMLDELIGLENVKEQVRKITAFARMKKDMALNGKGRLSVALNMEFVGNPGTAKTTVARILAGIFHETGLLPENELIEIGRADLVAKYEGQTAAKVRDVFQRARGRVLFIDEAYSLIEHNEGEFGDEAINTIVQEMENNRDNTIVIFAGYPDKMREFFGRNPGLRSRVPFRIVFNDYSAKEMAMITELEAARRGFSIGVPAKDKIMAVCEAAAGKADMGNGRFCRNLVERAVLSYASRVYGAEISDANVYGSEIPDTNHDYELLEDDFSVPDSGWKPYTTNAIGFRI